MILLLLGFKSCCLLLQVVATEVGSAHLSDSATIGFKSCCLLLQVVATEVGSAHLSDSATIVVHILDENDNVPVFSQQEYRSVQLSDKVCPIKISK